MTNVESFRATKKEPPLELLPPGNSFKRLVTAMAVAKVTRTHPADVAVRLYPGDKAVVRASSSPAMTGVAGWASDLAHKVVRDALEGLGPASCAAKVLARSLVLTWDGNGLISCPGFVAGAGSSSFVAEGQPIPVKQLASAAVLLQPYKLAAIGVLSREMMDSSNAEQLIGDVLLRSAGAALDVAFLGSVAASAAAPAGLLNGIATLTPSAHTDPMEAFYQDIRALIDSTSAVGGNGPFFVIGSPGIIAQMIMRFILQATGILDAANITVLSSNALVTNGILVCVAADALVCALSPLPTIETADAGELHMEDTSPLPVGTAGPARSLFQTNSVALKMRWPVTWMLRDPRGVAWTTPAWK